MKTAKCCRKFTKVLVYNARKTNFFWSPFPAFTTNRNRSRINVFNRTRKYNDKWESSIYLLFFKQRKWFNSKCFSVVTWLIEIFLVTIDFPIIKACLDRLNEIVSYRPRVLWNTYLLKIYVNFQYSCDEEHL